MIMLKMMFKYSQCEECVDQYKLKVEFHARPNGKMKIVFTKKKRVLRSPYYLCNKVWEQLNHMVQHLNSCYKFSIALRKVDLAKLDV